MDGMTMFDEQDGEVTEDSAFAVCSASELHSMGLIDEATMQQLMEPWAVEELAQAA